MKTMRIAKIAPVKELLYVIGSVVFAAAMFAFAMDSAMDSLGDTNYQQVVANTQQRVSAKMPRQGMDISELTVRIHQATSRLNADGLDRRVEEQDIALIAQQAAPYLAAELGTSKLNIPQVKIGRLGADIAGLYKCGTNTIIINEELDYLDAKRTYPHELKHAQKNCGTFYASITRIFSMSNPNNETKTEVAALEILANQALDGDIAAEKAFFGILSYDMSLLRRIESGNEGGLDSRDLAYFVRPAEIIKEAVDGRRTQYGGIELDGITALLRKLMLREDGKMW